MKIFKVFLPIEILFDLFDKVTDKYILTKSLFKKIQMNNLLQPFLDECCNYYTESSKKYLTKTPFTYKHFLTIVRQICRLNKTPFYYKLNYFHSEYEIVYYINEVNQENLEHSQPLEV